MGKFVLFPTSLALLLAVTLRFQADAAPPAAAPIIKHLSSLLKLTISNSKSTPSDGNVLQYEDGYIVETVVDGNALGVVPYSIRVSQDGELFAVDAEHSNIVRITPPLSQYSRARLVAGSFQGKTGHIDGKPSDARFNHPKGVTMDDSGNVYVADTTNLAIRKIGETGVTTIAGGKSNVPGYRDGPSDDAMFSSDFDIVYVQPTCSLLVVDRGNAALRKISLNPDDCDYQYSSISSSDIYMVVGAILVGYITCMLQQGYWPPAFPRTVQPSPMSFEEPLKEKATLVESVKEDPVAAWPSFGQLISDLSKLAIETASNIFLHLVPSRLQRLGSNKALTPLKDNLKMPEDEVEPQLAKKQRTPPPFSEVHQHQAYHPNVSDKYLDPKLQKMRSASLKDPSYSSKHRSSRRQEYAEFYGSSEAPPPYTSQVRPKSQKERKHRHRDKSGEMALGAHRSEPRPVETRAVNYDDPKFDHYSLRNRYVPHDSYRL